MSPEEVLAREWVVNYHGSVDTTALIMAFKAGARSRPAKPTPEALARALYPSAVCWMDREAWEAQTRADAEEIWPDPKSRDTYMTYMTKRLDDLSEQLIAEATKILAALEALS